MIRAESELPTKPRDSRHNASVLIWGALIVGTIAGIIFYLFPAIDTNTSAYFYKGHGIFSGKGGGIFRGAPLSTVPDFIRMTLYISFIAICVLASVGLVAAVFFKRNLLGFGTVQWAFLAACLITGPGLVGNVILKDNWGRARPVHLIEFGGTKTYSPPLTPSNQCDRNCSFISGESSMMFAAFFSAAFLFPRLSGLLIGVGVFMGLFSGAIRISQGAHFLSDVIFAGVTMALTVACIYLLFGIICRRIARNGGEKVKSSFARSPW